MANSKLKQEEKELTEAITLLKRQHRTEEGKLCNIKRRINDLKTIREDCNEELEKVKAEIKEQKDEFHRQKKVFDRQLKSIESVVEHRQALLNKVGILNLEDDSLERREEYQQRKEEKLKQDKQEIAKTMSELQKQKERAIAVRAAQSTSFYRPTDTEELFFLENRGNFLMAYEELGNITKAADRVGVRASLISHYKKKFPEFAEDMNIAYGIFKDRLDGELLDRAINGVEKVSFYKGEAVDTYVEKSDRLLEVATKAHIPERYDRGKLDRIEGSTSNNVTVNMISFKDAKASDLGTVEQVGVVTFVGEHGEMSRITGDRMDQHDESIDPEDVIIDIEEDAKQSRSIVFDEED